MEKPTIFALATVALVQNFGSTDLVNVNPETGCQHTGELAEQHVGLMAELAQCKQCFDPSLSFEFGFNFGLQLGAAVAEDPQRVPDIKALVAATKSAIRDFVREANSDNLGCTLCANAKEAATAA